jgi:hypothetical protein
LDLRSEVDTAGLDPGYILGNPNQPMTVAPPQICVYETPCSYLGVLRKNIKSDQNLYYERLQPFECEPHY